MISTETLILNACAYTKLFTVIIVMCFDSQSLVHNTTGIYTHILLVRHRKGKSCDYYYSRRMYTRSVSWVNVTILHVRELCVSNGFASKRKSRNFIPKIAVLFAWGPPERCVRRNSRIWPRRRVRSATPVRWDFRRTAGRVKMDLFWFSARKIM